MLIRSFVQRGRKISNRKTELLKNLLPVLEIKDTMPEHKNLNIEIGFGKGAFLSWLATTNPEAMYIGCEPYIAGVADLLDKIESKKIENIRLWTKDARLLIQQLPDRSLSNVYILFPDPWPKAKHHKRRLINQALLKLLAEKIRPDGNVFFATDAQDYAIWVEEMLENSVLFNIDVQHPWYKEFFDNQQTHYSKRAIDAQRRSRFYRFYLKNDTNDSKKIKK